MSEEEQKKEFPPYPPMVRSPEPGEYDCYLPIYDFLDKPEKAKAVIDTELREITGDFQRIVMIANYLGEDEYLVSAVNELVKSSADWERNQEEKRVRIDEAIMKGMEMMRSEEAL